MVNRQGCRKRSKFSTGQRAHSGSDRRFPYAVRCTRLKHDSGLNALMLMILGGVKAIEPPRDRYRLGRQPVISLMRGDGSMYSQAYVSTSRCDASVACRDRDY